MTVDKATSHLVDVKTGYESFGVKVFEAKPLEIDDGIKFTIRRGPAIRTCQTFQSQPERMMHLNVIQNFTGTGTMTHV